MAACVLCSVGVFVFTKPYMKPLSRSDAFARREPAQNSPALAFVGAFIGTIGIVVAKVLSDQPDLVGAVFMLLGSLFWALMVGLAAAVRAIK